jgi:NTP pyrophosphatase (non-canonical NTP hydrolase)
VDADLSFREAQLLAWANKQAHGFNQANVPLEFCLLQGEVAEAFDAWRTEPRNLGPELADVAIYVLGLAQMTGVDLQGEISRKMEINRRRVYRELPGGGRVKEGTHD